MGFRKYLSPDYLAFYVAALALLLSQLPPVTTWFAPGRLALAIGTYGRVTHYLGYPTLSVPVAATNTGSRSVTAERVECTLRHKQSGTTRVLRGESVVNEINGSFMPIAQLYFQPEASWSHVLQCAQIPGRLGYAETNALAVRAQTYFYDMANAPGFAPGAPAFLAPELVVEAERLFARNFWLETGEWQLTVSMATREGRVLGQATADLMLTDHAMEVLRESVGEYRLGLGINFPAMNRYVVPVPLIALADG